MQVKCKSAFGCTASNADRFLVAVHPLLSSSGPVIKVGLLSILKCKQGVVRIAEERVGDSPGLEAQAAKNPPIIVLDHHDRLIVVPQSVEEGQGRAAVIRHLVNALPFAKLHVVGQVGDVVRYHLVRQDFALALHLWLEIKDLGLLPLDTLSASGLSLESVDESFSFNGQCCTQVLNQWLLMDHASSPLLYLVVFFLAVDVLIDYIKLQQALGMNLDLHDLVVAFCRRLLD